MSPPSRYARTRAIPMLQRPRCWSIHNDEAAIISRWRPRTMNTYEIAFAIFGLVMLVGAITGTKESAGIRLLAVVISLVALVAAALAAIVSEGRR